MPSWSPAAATATPQQFSTDEPEYGSSRSMSSGGADLPPAIVEMLEAAEELPRSI